MAKVIDLTGKTLEYWKVICRAPDKIFPSGQRRTVWECRCILCGTTSELDRIDLENGVKCNCHKTIATKIVRIRICQECKRPFWGGPRAWFCPECRKERQREQNKKQKNRKKSGDVVPIGSVIVCEICGAKIVKKGGSQKFCAKCAERHLKEVDNVQSLEWRNTHINKIRENKRKLSQKRHANDKHIDTLMPGVAWDVGKRVFRASVNVDGKQIIIIQTKDWQLAFASRLFSARLKAEGTLDAETISLIQKLCQAGQINLGDYIKYTETQMDVYNRYLGGMTQADIAREIGRSRQAVQSVLKTIRDKNLRGNDFGD